MRTHPSQIRADQRDRIVKRGGPDDRRIRARLCPISGVSPRELDRQAAWIVLTVEHGKAFNPQTTGADRETLAGSLRGRLQRARA